jgi:Secretion system C-terminal sorting domain
MKNNLWILLFLLFLLPSFLLSQGDVRLTFPESNINNGIQALINAKALSYSEYDGGYGVSNYAVNITSATFNILNSSQFELDVNINANATFNLFLFGFDEYGSGSVKITGTVQVTPEGNGFYIQAKPTAANITLDTSLPDFVDDLIADFTDGYIVELPPIKLASFTSTLPNVIASYFESAVPQITLDAPLDKIIISLQSSGPKFVSVQNDFNGNNAVAEIESYENAQWVSYNSPKEFYWDAGTSHDVRALDDIIDYSSEDNKFKRWKEDGITLHQKNIQVIKDDINSASFYPVAPVTLVNDLESSGSGGQISIDGGSYNVPHNDYGFKSPEHSTITASQQTLNGTTWDFYGWEASGASLANWQNATTDLNVTQPNATVTAHYKGRLRSNLTSGYASNSQRKIVRTDNGIYHTVYQSDYYDIANNISFPVVYYAKSATSSFTSSWGADKRFPGSLGVGKGKNPSLDFYGDKVYMVHEAQDDTDIYVVLIVYDTISDTYTYVQDGEDNFVSGVIAGATFGSVKPVVGVTSDQIMVIWNESSSSKLKFKVWKKNNLNTAFYSGELVNSSTNSKNPSIAAGKRNSTYSKYYIVWQNSSSSIEYQYFDQKNTYSSWTPFNTASEIISSGSGFTNHNYPSISLMEYAQASQKPIVTWRGSKKEYQQENLAKSTAGGGGSWVWKYKTVVRPYASGPNWGAFYEVGSNVVASTINSSDNGESVIIYSQNNGAESRYVVRDAQGVYGVLILSHNGLRSHVSNAATLSDMRAIVFNKTSLPYTFTKSTTVFQQPQNKISTEVDYTAMRQGVVKKDTLEFVFNMGDIMLDGEEVLFKTRPDTLPINTLQELNDATRTVNFYLDNSSELFFSDIYYTAKTANADSVLSAEDEVRFQVELVRVSDGFIAGQMDKITYNRNTLEDHANIDYQLDCSGIEPGSYYLRLATDVKGDAEYFLGNGHNPVSGLGKKSYVQIGLSEISLPLSYKLAQNFPNPFNPSTTITYQIPKAGKVQIKIFDITGREITTLVDTQKEPGNYQVTFDAGRLATGVYIYRITSGSFTAQKKMLLVK